MVRHNLLPFFTVREERGSVGGGLGQLVLESHVQVEPVAPLLSLLILVVVWGDNGVGWKEGSFSAAA